MTRHRIALPLLLATSMLSGGCMVLPHTTVQVDPQCGTVTRREELQAVQVASIGACSNEGCAVLVAAAGVVAVASGAVSAVVALARNAGYWLEERTAHPACVRTPAPPAAPGPPLS